MITLIPLAMVTPNSADIYAPSRIRSKETVEQAEFTKRFAGQTHSILVSFAADGVSNPQRLTAYGRGLDCWYLKQGDLPVLGEVR